MINKGMDRTGYHKKQRAVTCGRCRVSAPACYDFGLQMVAPAMKFFYVLNDHLHAQ